MNKRIILAAAGILAAAVAGLPVMTAGCGNGGDQARADRMPVTASFYPMAEFARQVGGDKVDVTTLVSPGIEPHDYDPTPRDIAGVHNSRVFIYNGAGLEPWADKIRDDLQGSGVVVVDASQGISLLSKDAGEGAEDVPGTTSQDPHVWIDPILAMQEVDNIKEGMIEADPQNREYYEQNAEAYKRQLAALDEEFRGTLSDCARRDIVTSHQAFKYVGNRYGLDVVAISGLSPDEEPSPQKLAEIAQFARDRDVKYIFFETLVSPKLSDTIASEVGAGTLIFNPLEGLTEEETAQGKNYISVQRENLENLRKALDCG